MRHVFSIVLFVAAALGASSCGTAPSHDPASASTAPGFENPRIAQLHSGRLYPGDELEIYFEGNLPTVTASLRIDTTVRADGTVALISNKVFTAGGKMLGEFKREVRSYYVPRLFKRVTTWGPLEPEILYVGGEVKSPGITMLGGRTTLRVAIAAAGGFTPSANKKKVQLISADGERRIINCMDIPHPEEGVEVHGGDYIIVPRLSKWFFW